MLAAHRHGGRMTLLAFARSWDALRRAPTRPPRHARASCATLEHLLVASLGRRPEATDLGAAIADYRRRRASPRSSPAA